MKTRLFLSIKRYSKQAQYKRKIFGAGKGSSKKYKVVSQNIDPDGILFTSIEKYLYFRIFRLCFMIGTRKKVL